MTRLGCLLAIVAMAALAGSSPAAGDGAIAVGSTASVVKDGIAVGTAINYDSADEALAAALRRCHDFEPAPRAAAQCRSVGTFRGECYAISFDPEEGTPGAGWAIAATKELAEERALANCQITAGESRRAFCRIEESKCDDH